MTDRPIEPCHEVLVALMARLDGERAALTATAIAAHLQACDACRESAAGLTDLHTRLADVTYDGPRVDLWPEVRAHVRSESNTRGEWIAIAMIAAICIVWRTGQLLFEWPLPVVNAVVPLAALVAIAAWLIGDPLAIKLTPDLRQERA